MKKVERVDALFEFLRVLLGIIIAFALCVVIIVIMSGSDAGEAVRNFMIGPFMTKRRFGHVMAKWAAYMLTGMGMCFIYAAGRFNMAGEGTINLAPMPILLIMFGTSFGLNTKGGAKHNQPDHHCRCLHAGWRCDSDGSCLWPGTAGRSRNGYVYHYEHVLPVCCSVDPEGYHY